MTQWFVVSLVLVTAALLTAQWWPGSTVAVTLYKAHLLSLGGWGGYWLDRGLFPYDRPHTHLDCERWGGEVPSDDLADSGAYLQVASSAYTLGMLRRAIVVGACLVCVGLGA